MADACPRCGATGVDTDRCPRCGVVIPIYRRALEKMRQRPTPAPATTAAPEGASRAGASGPPRDTAPPARPAAPARPTIHRFTFHARGGSLFGIHIVNVLLTLLTLGVYYFWGKVRVRRYLMSQTEFEGDRFAYHGTGGELLFGFLKAVLFFVAPLVALGAVPLLPGGRPFGLPARVLSWVIVGLFVPAAMIGARRYRLSRTSWRGIRFSLRARTRTFMRLFLEGSMLTTLTLSLYYPIFEARRFGFLTAHSYFGQRRFGFDGDGRELVRSYVLALLLTPPTLGLCWFWFQARKLRYLWGHTTFEGARFRCFVTGGALLRLALVNAMLLVATLGLGWPWIAARNGRFLCSMIQLHGTLDLDAIVQEPQAAPATGDALSSLIGADVDFG